ncbi:MAG: nucleoside triphosphate pyrophosphohydrolase [Smithella sp.]|nr:nucleoside triphosphate pyrophosphohydrolase [Smithella sp.]
MKKEMEETRKLSDMIKLIKTLRAPDGCPWDRQQKKEDIGKYLLEESYEVVDALANQDSQALKEELGDLLFQILFLSAICAESNLFSLNDVMEEISKKMIRRHPHVFGDTTVNSVQDVKDNWQRIKQDERKDKSLFEGIPRSFPALKRAQKITSIASTLGFDWSDVHGVLKKHEEEIRELDVALKTGDRNKMEEELGDVLFTIVNLSRFLSVDAETALSKTTEKFLRRFSHVTEGLASRGLKPEEATLEQMDALWNEAKNKD